MRVLEHMNVPRCIAYSADGSLMAVGDEAAITVYSLPGLETVAYLSVKGRIASVEALAFSPDGGKLAAGMAGGEVRVWDVPSQEVASEALGHEGGVRGLAWPAEGEIVSAGWDREVRWWGAGLGTSRRMNPASVPLTCLAVRPDKSFAGGSSHGSLLLSARMSKQCVPVTVPVSHPVFALALTRDGKTLAAGHANGLITLWDFPKWEPVGELTGHEWVVYGLAFTPDGSRLVSGGADGSVRLWDVPHRRLVETYRWHKSWVTCVGVSPDGMTAATGGDDYDLVVWDLADV